MRLPLPPDRVFHSLSGLIALALLAACGGAQTPEPPAQRAVSAPQGPRVVDRDPNAIAPSALRLPPATRQLDEGYWLGAMIGPGDVATLRRMGIRVVLSAVNPSLETQQALAEAGIHRVSVPMGSTFDHDTEILGVVDYFAPEEVFIHCRHGADRTGAIAAFILVVRHGWSVADALYSVVYESVDDLDGLAHLLAQSGIDDVRPPDDPSVGFYSVRAAGGIGGLKTRNERYGRLVSTTIEAIRAYGPDR